MLEIFTERFKDLRIEKNLSASKLAQELGVRDTTVIRWEKGLMIPNALHLYNIAKFFGVSSDYLIGLEN